jgi:hypothetical protein
MRRRKGTGGKNSFVRFNKNRDFGSQRTPLRLRPFPPNAWITGD